jgi:plastocyanin
MKSPIVLCSLLTIGIIGFWLFGVQSSKVSDVGNELSSESMSANSENFKTKLSVGPQSNVETVIVSETVLTTPGFLVVREVIDGTAGQIVEISPYLDTGTYSSIEIPLGEFYSGENELMVLIYEDAGSNQVLNDLDQPFVDAGGDFVARFVATGDVVANEVIEAKPAGISLADMGMNAQTITYTNEGFVPATLDVGVGAMVHFVNESDMQMWVASDSHPAHDILPTFDQFKPGDMFMYVFEETGTWKYHDHLNPTAVGEIVVKEN